MTFADVALTDQPRHARSEPRRKRRYGGLVVVGLYLIIIGLNEWRLQRYVESIRARENVPAVIEEPIDR